MREDPERDTSVTPTAQTRGVRNAALLTDVVAEASELVLCDPETSAVVCDAYVFEPDAGERTLGSLAFIIETINVSLPSPSGPEQATARQRPAALHGNEEANEDGDETTRVSARRVLEAVARALRAEYYRDPRREMLPSFEAALSAANAALARVAEQGFTDWLMNLHVAIAAHQGGTVHVARVGQASLYLVRQGNITDIGEGLADPRVRNPRAVFTNVASGTVSEQDVIMLASPNLFRIVPKDRCASLLTGKSPREAVSYTRDLLAEVRETPPVAAVFLRFVKAPIALPAPTLPPAEARPAAFLPPPAATLRSSVPQQYQRLVRPPLRLRRSRWQHATALLPGLWSVVLLPALRRFVYGLGRLARAGGQGARTLVEKSSGMRHLFRGGVPRPALPSAAVLSPAHVTSALVRAPLRVRETVTGWPRSTKTFLALTVLLGLLFAGSLFALRRKGIEDAAIRAVSEKLQEARVKKDAAEAALIYENLNEARRVLREARAGAETVKASPYYGAEADRLLSTLRTIEDRTELIVRVPEPALVGDFGAVAADRNVGGLAAVGDHLFVFHPTTNAILRLAVAQGETKTVSQTSQGIGHFRNVTVLPREQMLLLATDSPGLALFDTVKGDLVKQELSPLPESTKEIRSLATFGSRLYALLPEHKQIFGYSKTLAGFTGGTPWVKEANVPVDRAVDLGVDGYIYLLFNDGKIAKLLKGSPVDFAQSELTVPLKSPSRLVVNETLKHLYVLDPPEKRVVVYDTTGKLTQQYLFPNAQELRDIAVAGKEETLFVLDGTAAYKIPLQQKK